MTSGNDLAFTIPDQAQKWQKLGAEADYRSWRLIRTAGIYHSNAAIVRGECEGISAWGKRTSMDPAGGVIQILTAHRVKRQAFPPYTSLWSFVNPFDEAGKDPGMCIGRSRPK